MNKKLPVISQRNNSFRFHAVERRASWRADWPSIVKKKEEKKRKKVEKGRRGTEKKIQKNWQCCEMIGRVCSHGRRVPAATTLPSESVFAPGCPRQIFGTDALWVTPGGGQLRRRGQSMLAISCSLRGRLCLGQLLLTNRNVGHQSWSWQGTCSGAASPRTARLCGRICVPSLQMRLARRDIARFRCGESLRFAVCVSEIHSDETAEI